MSPSVDRDYLVRTLTGLIRINSINPTLVPGGAGEAEIAAYTADSLARCGLEIKTYEPEAGRPSVVGRLAGSGRGRSLMLNAHYDTVGVDGMPEPFSAAIRDGKLYGRGAYDMKSSLAACMTAAKALADAGSPQAGDVLVAAVADEEYGSLGTASVIANVKVDGAIVTEPTSLKICLAHKGYLWIEVETTGRAAHGSRFNEGLDANMRMGRFLAELDLLERELRGRPPHPLVGPPSLHAAMIHGGSGLSTYAASCKLQIERRSVPGETEAQAMHEIQDIISRLSARDSSFHATAKAFFVREPFEVSPDAAIVKSVDRAATKVLGRPQPRFGDTPWMDAALLSAAGVETVVIGPHGAGAHAIEEWVDVESAVYLAEILVQAALDYCRSSGAGPRPAHE
ncbi:MAG: ArgE/DapE family deacylase [Candidatus Solibacter usitatus]|nr:ArgE/DapE family deacylase [Candidatus Solibacter usitatus]